MLSTAGSPDCAGGTIGERAASNARTFFAVNMSIAISPTPTQIAMSATLNVGQWWSTPFQNMWTSMKSMTQPSRTRSNTLPSAPPSTSGSPQRSARCRGCSRR